MKKTQKECKIEEGHLVPDHVHMLITIPPKYSAAHVVGYNIESKTAMYIARTFLGHKLNYGVQHFFARGYYVSTVGREGKMIGEYIKRQEEHDRKLDQWNLFDKTPQDPS